MSPARPAGPSRLATYFHVHLVSDSTGETLNAMAKAVVARFDGVIPIEHIYALVRSDRQMERVLEEISAAPGVVLHTLVDRDLREQLPGTGFAAERHCGLAAESMFAAIHDHPENLVTTPAIERLDDALVGKLLARNPHLTDDEFITAVTEIVGDRAVVAFSGAGGLAEVSAKGVTKAAALAGWCAELGIDAGEVWAFGDMPNDMEMLRWADHGVAMGNAIPIVHEVADEDGARQLGVRALAARTGALASATLAEQRVDSRSIGAFADGGALPDGFTLTAAAPVTALVAALVAAGPESPHHLVIPAAPVGEMAAINSALEGAKLREMVLTKALRPIADEVGLSMAQLAVAWVLQNRNVAAAIIGASRPEQVEENVAASGVTLEPQVLAQIDAVLGEHVERDAGLTEANAPKRRPS